MFSQKIQDAMNDQIQRELESAYIYLSMAAYFESSNLPGFAHWMNAQAQEEQTHAMKFFDFIYDRGGRVMLQAIPQPPAEFTSPLDAFEKALAHEQKITGHIDDLYALAVQEKDYASQTFLQWFVDEQVEEEKSAGDIVETLKMVGDKGQALFMFDRQLAQR
ncbi:MAG: ferritin [Anaerolineae bacterium]|nr:MAG: ferritin [Anaerolineae bacterium]